MPDGQNIPQPYRVEIPGVITTTTQATSLAQAVAYTIWQAFQSRDKFYWGGKVYTGEVGAKSLIGDILSHPGLFDYVQQLPGKSSDPLEVPLPQVDNNGRPVAPQPPSAPPPQPRQVPVEPANNFPTDTRQPGQPQSPQGPQAPAPAQPRPQPQPQPQAPLPSRAHSNLVDRLVVQAMDSNITNKDVQAYVGGCSDLYGLSGDDEDTLYFSILGMLEDQTPFTPGSGWLKSGADSTNNNCRCKHSYSEHSSMGCNECSCTTFAKEAERKYNLCDKVLDDSGKKCERPCKTPSTRCEQHPLKKIWPGAEDESQAVQAAAGEDPNQPVCSNCGQFQWPIKDGSADCMNQCALKGMAPKTKYPDEGVVEHEMTDRNGIWGCDNCPFTTDDFEEARKHTSKPSPVFDVEERGTMSDFRSVTHPDYKDLGDADDELLRELNAPVKMTPENYHKLDPSDAPASPGLVPQMDSKHRQRALDNLLDQYLQTEDPGQKDMLQRKMRELRASLRKQATGEMGNDDLTRDQWPWHFAVADAIGGEVKPFDQYQGPYIWKSGVGKIWISQDEAGDNVLYFEQYRDSISVDRNSVADVATQYLIERGFRVEPGEAAEFGGYCAHGVAPTRKCSDCEEEGREGLDVLHWMTGGSGEPEVNYCDGQDGPNTEYANKVTCPECLRVMKTPSGDAKSAPPRGYSDIDTKKPYDTWEQTKLRNLTQPKMEDAPQSPADVPVMDQSHRTREQDEILDRLLDAGPLERPLLERKLRELRGQSMGWLRKADHGSVYSCPGCGGRLEEGKPLCSNCGSMETESAMIKHTEPRGCPPDCGGCSCHIAPPCDHCVSHVDPDSADGDNATTAQVKEANQEWWCLTCSQSLTPEEAAMHKAEEHKVEYLQ